MILPAWLRDPRLRIRRDPAQKIGTDLQSAGSSQSLHRDHPILPGRRTFGSEHQGLHRAVIGGQAVDGQVAARGRLFGELGLRAAHAFQQRHLTVVVVIHPDPEIDLVGVLVGVEGLGHA